MHFAIHAHDSWNILSTIRCHGVSAHSVLAFSSWWIHSHNNDVEACQYIDDVTYQCICCLYMYVYINGDWQNVKKCVIERHFSECTVRTYQTHATGSQHRPGPCTHLRKHTCTVMYMYNTRPLQRKQRLHNAQTLHKCRNNFLATKIAYRYDVSVARQDAKWLANCLANMTSLR